MPVATCSGREPCNRLVSISAVPGGNPAAKAEPDAYASEWTLCSCKAYTCDRCLVRQQGRCRCGAPARLFTEPERIQIARGGPPPSGGAASPPPPVSARPVLAGPQAPVRPALEGIAQQIEAEVARGNQDRARAMATLAATVMQQQGQSAPEAEIPWLLRFGESFYRWRCFAEGAQFWKGLFQLLHKRGRGLDTREGLVAVATCGAFQVLSGELTAKAEHAGKTLSVIRETFGPDHVLVRDVQARLGPLAPASGAPPAPPPPAAYAPSKLAAGLDPSTKLALWVTLAFLDIAMADGKVEDAEYLAWKQAMARMQLPDVWERFGLQGLVDMSQKGMLHELSAELVALPPEGRAKMAGTLVEFMMADGRAEPREIEAVKRIGGWLGVALEIEAGPAASKAPAPAPPPAPKPTAVPPNAEILPARVREEIDIWLSVKAPGCDKVFREVPTVDGPVLVVDVDDEPPRTYYFRVAYPNGVMGEGGVPGPSRLVQPSELLTFADVYSKRVPASPDGLAPPQREKAKADITRAAQYVEEVLKFIPPGASAVPGHCFVTEVARAAYQKEPGRYDGARLEAVAQAYRRVAARF